MAQIQRKSWIIDSLDLLDENGNVCYSLPVELNIEQAFTRVIAARKNAALTEAELKRQHTDEAAAAYGKAVCELLGSVFGDDGTEKICEHYKNRYTEMLLDILPYLAKDIFPRFDEFSKARLQQMVELRKAVGGNRAQRRHRK